jgi:transposase
MPKCKECGSERTIKNGVVAGKQRYRCQECGCNFREGDNRTNKSVATKKALCVLLYAMTKGSFRMMGRILGINYALVYRWIKSLGESLPEPEIPGDIEEMEFDEMWHFVGSKKQALAYQSH